jgi:predicted dithiol-disulfide oxidoreductase (DUF899 family)
MHKLLILRRPHPQSLTFAFPSNIVRGSIPRSIRQDCSFQEAHGLDFPQGVSFGSDFNYDFHVTLDEAVAPVEYNFKDNATLKEEGKSPIPKGELPGTSVFYRENQDIFHTYSTYARGDEWLITTYRMLDITPLGRQEDDPGRKLDFPHHDKYGEQ